MFWVRFLTFYLDTCVVQGNTLFAKRWLYVPPASSVMLATVNALYKSITILVRICQYVSSDLLKHLSVRTSVVIGNDHGDLPKLKGRL
jgi:hypothetical protein